MNADVRQELEQPVQELAAKAGAVITNGAAAWSWIGHVNDLLQLIVTALGILTGIATYRYVTAKRKAIEKRADAEVE